MSRGRAPVAPVRCWSGSRPSRPRVDAAPPDDAAALPLVNSGAILLDADAQFAGIVSDGTQEPSEPAAPGEVLVNDGIPRVQGSRQPFRLPTHGRARVAGRP